MSAGKHLPATGAREDVRPVRRGKTITQDGMASGDLASNLFQF